MHTWNKLNLMCVPEQTEQGFDTPGGLSESLSRSWNRKHTYCTPIVCELSTCSSPTNSAKPQYQHRNGLTGLKFYGEPYCCWQPIQTACTPLLFFPSEAFSVPDAALSHETSPLCTATVYSSLHRQNTYTVKSYISNMNYLTTQL